MSIVSFSMTLTLSRPLFDENIILKNDMILLLFCAFEFVSNVNYYTVLLPSYVVWALRRQKQKIILLYHYCFNKAAASNDNHIVVLCIFVHNGPTMWPVPPHFFSYERLIFQLPAAFHEMHSESFTIPLCVWPSTIPTV